MTDFNNQNNTDSTQKYSPLTTDYVNPPNNLTPDTQIKQTNITPEENNLKNSKEYIIYKTPYDSCQILSFNIMLVVSIFISTIAIISNINNGFIYLSLLLPLLFLFMGSYITYRHYIAYDSSQTRIILKKEKIFKCINNNKIIQINDIRKVIFKKYEDNEANHCFKINFILVKEKNITAVDAFERGGREYPKAFQSLKNILPEGIYFEEI